MTPPRLARWLIAVLSPRADRADILADLDADFASRPAPEGRQWYWQQVRQSAAPLLRRRVQSWAAAPMGWSQDVTFAVRSLRSAPSFAIGVILMLALGIGAHVVVSAVVDGMLLRPLPFGDHSDRLVTIHSLHPTIAPDWDDAGVSYPDLMDMRHAEGFESIEGVMSRNVSLSSPEQANRVLAASITPGLFPMLGVTPALGRGFTNDDAAPLGQETSAIISASLWHGMFGGQPDIVGSSVLMNGRALTIIGVMPDHFSFPSGQELWLPLRADETAGRANRSYFAVGLLRAGRSIDQGRAELNRIASTLASEYPQSNRGWSAYAMPIRSFFVAGKSQTSMFGAVTLVLIVVCANVAGLIVARGVGRQRELTLRAALGAGRARLVRLLVTETALLAIVGGSLGFLAASWGVRALVAWSPEPPPYWATPEVDLRVALFATALTATVALVAGLLPALRISKVDASGALLPGARPNVGSPRTRRLQHWLVAGQVAFSFALLVGAGLLTRSANALLTADGGFNAAPLLSFRFYIAGDRYDDPNMRGAVVNDVVNVVAAIPGVASAGSTGSIPTDDGGDGTRVQDPAAPGDVTREIGVQATPAGPTFFSALNVPLIDGRTFTTAESADADADIVVVNARLAARLWPGETAVGHTLRISGGDSFVPARVIGVAPNLVYEEFGEETPQSQLMVYVPTARAGWRTQAVLMRVNGDPASVAPQLRAAVRRVDPGFAVYDVMTMTDRRGYNHWGNRFMGRAASDFAIVALLLAAIGAYSIVSYTVAQRTREIGVRLALGSSRSGIVRVFLALGGRLAVWGGVVGLALAAVVARALSADLFRVSPWTPSDWITPAVLLALAVIAATYLPARRASRVDPAVALRSE
jgi:predicted permease